MIPVIFSISLMATTWFCMFSLSAGSCCYRMSCSLHASVSCWGYSWKPQDTPPRSNWHRKRLPRPTAGHTQRHALPSKGRFFYHQRDGSFDGTTRSTAIFSAAVPAPISKSLSMYSPTSAITRTNGFSMLQILTSLHSKAFLLEPSPLFVSLYSFRDD